MSGFQQHGVRANSIEAYVLEFCGVVFPDLEVWNVAGVITGAEGGFSEKGVGPKIGSSSLRDRRGDVGLLVKVPVGLVVEKGGKEVVVLFLREVHIV